MSRANFVVRFKAGYMESVGSHCDTEMEYFNKVGKAKEELTNKLN